MNTIGKNIIFKSRNKNHNRNIKKSLKNPWGIESVVDLDANLASLMENKTGKTMSKMKNIIDTNPKKSASEIAQTETLVADDALDLFIVHYLDKESAFFQINTRITKTINCFI